ncbi:alpha/beta fold hydrolase [Kitasatospora sp. NPDC050543]|uniref:alpha/beta fold hydrolase n=1 Tax=Kitasatospora sp. NPDC050543 TaxID=3364054 RepID=UPI0037A42CCB
MTASTTSATAAAGRPLPKAAEAEHRWVEVRGIRLHVSEYGAGAPVLLLHGFPQHWFAWDRVAVLSAAGRRLICPDLRGFGWSEQTRRGYDIDGLAEDMLALLDALGLDRVGLVGHDWGAHVGFRLCLRAPERFSGFLALNMVHPWARQRAILPNLWRQWYTAFVEYPVIGRAVLRHWPAFSRFLLRHQVADPSVWQADELAEFSAAAQAGAHAGQAMFWQYVVREIPALLRGTWRGRRLTVPTLLLGGERDNVIPPSMLAGGESHACELTVRIVPGVGHFLPQESPRVVAEAMNELFATGG